MRAAGPCINGYFRPVQRQFGADEPILVDFVVRNDGNVPFEVEAGGDYRFAGGRSERFNVEVVSINRWKQDTRYRTESGDGRGSEAMLQPGDTYRERLFLNTWGDFATPGVYTVTCRRVLTHSSHWNGAPGWVTARLEGLPLDITRPDARQILLDRYVRGRPSSDPEVRQIADAIDTYLHFPQVLTTFEVGIVPGDRAKLRALVAALQEDQDGWRTAHWYVQFLAEELGVPTQESTKAGVGARPFQNIKADLLAKLGQ